MLTAFLLGGGGKIFQPPWMTVDVILNIFSSSIIYIHAAFTILQIHFLDD